MPFTRLGEGGYGVRRAGNFSGKTPSGGGGGGAHPVGVLTRFSMDGYGARRAGSFSGKTPSGGGGGGGSHPVGTLTRFGLEGYGVRRASFSAKTPATSTAGVVGLFAYWVGGAGAGTTPTPTPTPTGQVGGGGDDVPRRRRKSPHRGFDLQAWKERQTDFEGTVREAYEALMRGPDADEADRAVAGHRGRSGIDWPAVARDDRALADLLELRQRASDEEEEIIVMLLH